MNFTINLLVSFLLISCVANQGNGHSTIGSNSLFNRNGKIVVPTSGNVTDYIEDNVTSAPNSCPLFLDGESDGNDFPIIANSGKREWNQNWSKAALNTLNRDDFKNLLEKDLNKEDLKKLQCPNFNSMNVQDKKKFYIILISAMAHSESGYKPTTYFDENAYAKKTGSTKAIDDSYGLLQIDPGNARGVRKCGVKKVKKTGKVVRGRNNDGGLYDGSKNVECGLVFLKWQLTKQTDGQIFSPKSYWSTLRPKNKSSIKTTDKFNSQIAQISSCKGSTHKPVSLPTVGQRDQMDMNSKCNIVADSSRGAKAYDQSNSAYEVNDGSTSTNTQFDL